MNIITIRNELKTLAKIGAVPPRMAGVIPSVPVFNMPAINNWTPEEIQWCRENICVSGEVLLPAKLPFETFAVWFPYDKPDDDSNDTLYFVSSDPAAFREPAGTKEPRLLIVATQRDRVDGNRYTVGGQYSGASKSGCEMRLWKNEKQVPPGIGKMNALAEKAGLFRSVILRVCYEIMSKTSAVVRVSPEKRASKSVEWHLARVHYCVLSKKQAMSIRDRKGDVGSHDVHRAAHWRRAHFRVLSSPKFTNKRGSKILVHEAWVGPEEWIGQDGKVYKVIQ